MALQRTAKSCGSDAPMLASSLREEAQATVSNKPGHRGEREVSRKTIARGVPGDFRCDRGDYARVLCFISHARLRVHWAPGIPCALCFLWADDFLQNSDASRREIAESRRHCEERLVRRSSTSEGGSDEAIHPPSFRDGAPAPDPESRDSGFDA